MTLAHHPDPCTGLQRPAEVAREREGLCASRPQGTSDSESWSLSWWGPRVSAAGRTGRRAPGRESQLPGQLRDSIRPLGSRPVSLDSRTDVESPVLTPHPSHSLSSLPGSQGPCHGDAWTSTGKQGGRRQTAATLTCRGARSVSPAGSSTDPRLAENVSFNGPLPSGHETPVVTTCAQ